MRDGRAVAKAGNFPSALPGVRKTVQGSMLERAAVTPDGQWIPWYELLGHSDEIFQVGAGA